MLRRIQLLLTSLLALCGAGSAEAIDTEAAVATADLGNTTPAMIILAIAIALLLTLVLRSAASHVMQIFATKNGRRRVRTILSARSQEVLDDFIIPGAYGGLTHIDYAVLTSSVIICIQTKCYKGIILGGADEPQWTNEDGVRRRTFLNPLIQSQGRAQAIQKIVPDFPVVNLVVFTGDIHFSSPPEKNVIRVRDLDCFISQFVDGQRRTEDRDALWQTVKSAALTDDASRKDFNAQLSFS